MTIGERLRDLRKAKGLSQAELEKRTGLMWCYISRLENGHVTPGLQTLEKFAHALETPLYQILYDADADVAAAKPSSNKAPENPPAKKSSQLRLLQQFMRSLAGMSEKDRELLLSMAEQMAKRGRAKRLPKQDRTEEPTE
jgi:transcriptional regulator with XRE-family HTH domain